jgi:chromosomal replication initiator protein
MAFPPEVWDGVLRRLAAELPSFATESWLAPLVPEASETGLRLLSPNIFHRNRVREQLLARIRELVREEHGAAIDVAVELGGTDEQRSSARAHVAELCKGLDADDGAARSGGSGPASAPAARPVRRPRSVERRGESGGSGKSRGPRREARLPSGPRRPVQPNFNQSFDNFVVGSSNALAREASLAIAAARHADLRQLYLCSAPGLGKTHLARAASVEASRSERVRYATAEAFTNEFMNAVRTKTMPAFTQRYRRSCDVLVIDDVPFFAGKVGTQLEFFHTVQQLLDCGSRVVLTGDRPPGELHNLEPSLRAQLESGFVATIEAPDDELRRGVLRSKASAGGVRLPEDCIEAIIESIEGSLRALDGMLVQLVTTASLLKRPIDLALTREVLTAKGAIPRADAVAPTPELVIEEVARFFKTTAEALASRSRRRDVLVPRQLAMFLCRRFTDASLPEIGRAFDRDHPAVRNAIRRVESDVMKRAKLRYQLEAVSERVRERLGR